MNSRPGRLHRAKAIDLPGNPDEATAVVLEALLNPGGTPVDRSAAIEAQRERVSAILSNDSSAALESLASHSLVVDALAKRFAIASTEATTVEARAKFAKLALQAIGAHARLLAAIEGLKAVRAKGARIVSIDDDTGGDDDAYVY